MNTGEQIGKTLWKMTPGLLVCATIVEGAGAVIRGEQMEFIPILLKIAWLLAIMLALLAAFTWGRRRWERWRNPTWAGPVAEAMPAVPRPSPDPEAIAKEQRERGTVRMIWLKAAAANLIAAGMLLWVTVVMGEITGPDSRLLWVALAMASLGAGATLRVITLVPAQDYSPGWVVTMAGLMLIAMLFMDRTGDAAAGLGMEDLRHIQTVITMATGMPATAIMAMRGMRRLRQTRGESSNRSAR